MKLTNGQIWVASTAVKGLMGQKLPVQVSIRLVKLAQELDIHLAVITGVRNNLITQHAVEKDAAGNPMINDKTPEMAAFSKDWAELMAEEIDLEFKGEKIKLPWTVNIEPSILIALEPFISMD